MARRKLYPGASAHQGQITASGERIAARGKPIATEGFPAMATDFHIDLTKPKRTRSPFCGLVRNEMKRWNCLRLPGDHGCNVIPACLGTPSSTIVMWWTTIVGN